MFTQLKNLFHQYPALVLAGGVVLGLGLYVGLTAVPGFPLDDAWIHQTYARNLVRNGRWEYVPGVVSAGSTAPLWTFLLAIGYWLRLPYLLWAYGLGGISLGWLAWGSLVLWRSLWPEWKGQALTVGFAVLFTWPLVWAAASGMETLLFAALGVHILQLYSQKKESQSPPAAVLGFLCGLLVLTRPDGLILLLLILLGLLVQGRSYGLRFIATAVLPLLPYFVFNLWSGGGIWPNTFYAKQAEYAVVLEEPLVSRLVRLLFFTLGGPESGWRGISGVHLLLLPGLVTAVYHAFRRDWQAKRLFQLLPLLWAGGHVALYAWRLPVTYQHGRYLLAALPIWVLFGWAGWQMVWQVLPLTERIGRLFRLTFHLTYAVLLGFFLLLGAQAYARDVAIIEGEMVAVAHWLAENTPPDALIAAHDIGAIGYFAERPLIDLAGLISPEVVPLLADETALADYILQSPADYLVTAPGWNYEKITKTAELRYSTDFPLTQEQGTNNMKVYQLRPS